MSVLCSYNLVFFGSNRDLNSVQFAKYAPFLPKINLEADFVDLFELKQLQYLFECRINLDKNCHN